MLKRAHEHLDAMRKEFNKNDAFKDVDPPVEFSMDDYDKAVKSPEYIQITKDPFIETPAVSDQTTTPEIKQEPTDESQITELPQETTTRKSREERNLESTLDGPKWKCSGDHGRRLRYRNNFLESSQGPVHTWDSEHWDNIRTLEDADHQNNEGQ